MYYYILQRIKKDKICFQYVIPSLSRDLLTTVFLTFKSRRRDLFRKVSVLRSFDSAQDDNAEYQRLAYGLIVHKNMSRAQLKIKTGVLKCKTYITLP